MDAACVTIEGQVAPGFERVADRFAANPGPAGATRPGPFTALVVAVLVRRGLIDYRERRISMGYVINRMGDRTIGDPRGSALSRSRPPLPVARAIRACRGGRCGVVAPPSAARDCACCWTERPNSSTCAAYLRPRWPTLAEALGISRTSLYYYIGDREDLVFQCYMRACEFTAGDLAARPLGLQAGLSASRPFIGLALSPTAPHVAGGHEAKSTSCLASAAASSSTRLRPTSPASSAS